MKTDLSGWHAKGSCLGEPGAPASCCFFMVGPSIFMAGPGCWKQPGQRPGLRFLLDLREIADFVGLLDAHVELVALGPDLGGPDVDGAPVFADIAQAEGAEFGG